VSAHEKVSVVGAEGDAPLVASPKVEFKKRGALGAVYVSTHSRSAFGAAARMLTLASIYAAPSSAPTFLSLRVEYATK